jgi:hypothetical protein
MDLTRHIGAHESHLATGRTARRKMENIDEATRRTILALPGRHMVPIAQVGLLLGKLKPRDISNELRRLFGSTYAEQIGVFSLYDAVSATSHPRVCPRLTCIGARIDAHDEIADRLYFDHIDSRP